jgi:hypothetical protein
MPIAEWVALLQMSSPESESSGSTAGWYFVILLIAAVLALVVWMFIRTSVGRSSHR